MDAPLPDPLVDLWHSVEQQGRLSAEEFMNAQQGLLGAGITGLTEW